MSVPRGADGSLRCPECACTTPADARPVCCWWCGYDLDLAAVERPVCCPECGEVNGPPPAEAPLRPEPWPGRARLVMGSAAFPAAAAVALLLVPPHLPGLIVLGPLVVVGNALVWPWNVVEARVAAANRGPAARRLGVLATVSGAVVLASAAAAVMAVRFFG